MLKNVSDFEIIKKNNLSFHCHACNADLLAEEEGYFKCACGALNKVEIGFPVYVKRFGKAIVKGEVNGS